MTAFFSDSCTLTNNEIKVMAERKKQSKALLQIMRREDDSKVCKIITSNKCGNTSNIQNHLSSQHWP